MKRILLFVIVFSLLASVSLFADPSVEVQYNEPGQINLTGVVGLHLLGLSVGAGAEFIMGDLDFFPEFPMEWGLAVRAVSSFYLFKSYSGFEYGAAPLATLHKGIYMDENLEFDLSLGIGLGLYGYNYTYSYSLFGTNYDTNYSEPIKIGFASFNSISWKMKEDLWLTVEYAYVGRGSVYGVGIRKVL